MWGRHFSDHLHRNNFKIRSRHLQSIHPNF
jgi:hypothetical protein